MRIGATSVTTENAAEICRLVATSFKKALGPFFVDKNYGAGIDSFAVGMIIVDSDPLENDMVCKRYHKAGYYLDPFSKERIRFIDFALPFDPTVVEAMTEEQLRQLFCAALLDRIDNPDLKIPKDFDYMRFANDMRFALEIYSRATFE